LARAAATSALIAAALAFSASYWSFLFNFAVFACSASLAFSAASLRACSNSLFLAASSILSYFSSSLAAFFKAAIYS
jgi:hypothetical protein